MEITRREIVASLTIIAVWICLGFLISGRINDWQQDKTAEYDKAARIESQEIFEHGMATNLGNAFVYGELEAAEPVSYEEIKGEYSYIRKVKEVYTQHTRTVEKTRTTANGKTETYTEIETYWTWDEVHWESRGTKNILFLKHKFPAKKCNLPGERYIDTIDGGYHVRYVYYGVPAKLTGTIYTKLEKGTISDNSEFWNGEKIEEVVESLEKSYATVIFWIFWVAAMAAVVYGFYCLDNYWLNR